MLYDDTYVGPRFRYGMNNRPLATANLPKGWVVFSARPHPYFPNFGTVDFPARLSDAEAVGYELTLVEERPNG